MLAQAVDAFVRRQREILLHAERIRFILDVDWRDDRRALFSQQIALVGGEELNRPVVFGQAQGHILRSQRDGSGVFLEY